MKMKQFLRSILAVICCTSLVVGSFGSHIGTVLADDTTTVTPPEFEQITFSDFDIEDDTYGYTPYYAPDGREFHTVTKHGSYEGGLKNKTFVGKVNFSTGGNQACITFGGKSSGESGFAIGTWAGSLRYWDPGWVVCDDVYSLSGDAPASVIGQSQTIKISFEVFAQDSDGLENDVRIWLYFGDQLYNDSYLCVLQDHADDLGNYVGIFTYNNDGSTVSVESVEPPAPPAASLPTDFTLVTPKEFGLLYQTYEGTTAEDPLEDTSLETPVSTMHEVRFDTRITMGSSAVLIYTKSGGEEWAGLIFRISGNRIWLQNWISGSDEKVWVEDVGTYSCYLEPSIAIEGATTFVDQSYLLSITTEYVGNDLKLGVWFDYKLYNEQYFYIKDCTETIEPGLNLVRYTGDIILEAPTPLDPIVTNETYNLSDGPYLITGTGTITVNGTGVDNGTTLTEPGEYQIVSDHGRITRNVTLQKTGSVSSAITYEDGVMPIIGYHGPYNGTDSRGNEYTLITEENYQLLSNAGFNLISKVDLNWSNAKQRTDIIQSLEYAEKYGMGLFVWDSGLQSGELTDAAVAEQISQYSQYESFKGIYVTDEPETPSYNNPKLNSPLSYYEEQAKAINRYCNLNAYINLLPKEDAYGSFSTYVDEYLDMTDGRYISYDYYAFGKTFKQNNKNGLSGQLTGTTFSETGNIQGHFDNLSSARAKSIEKGIPFWPYIQVGNYWNTGENDTGIKTNNDSPTREQLLWNVNTSLAYGAKGIQYFPMVQPDYFAYAFDNTYDYERNGVLGANGEPTQWYPHVKEANEQIAAVDEYLLAATSEKVLAKGTAAQNDTGISEEANGVLETITVSDTANGAIVGAFKYEGNDMFYVVNYDTAGTTPDSITLNFAETKGYRLIKDGTETLGEGTSCTLSIDAGEAVLVIIDDTVLSDSGMTRLTPLDFVNLPYGEYVAADYANGEYGETVSTCTSIDSMDKVMFKTGLTMGNSVRFTYMKNSNSTEWNGLVFTNSSGNLTLQNWMTSSETFYVQGEETARSALQFDPALALNKTGITSWTDELFYLTLTIEFVAYDDEAENDLKLGIYFNDKLYKNAYIYILNCKDICAPNIFLYRPTGAGSLHLSSPVVFETQLQPEITDSIAMTYRAILADKVEETPTMTFERNGKEMTVSGTQVSAKAWQFTYPDLYVQNMAETVNATLKVGEYTKTYSTSMLDYSAYVLGLEAGTTYTAAQLRELKNLIVDLVQYGATVQRYKNYNISEEALLTTKLTALVPDYTTHDLEDATTLEGLTTVTAADRLTGTSTDTTYTWKSASLVLGNKVKIRYKFTAASVENLTIKAIINHNTYVLAPEQLEEGIWFVEFDSIYAYEYDEPISVSFYVAGKQVGKTVNYSVNTYLDAMKTYAEVDESIWSNLLLAIHNYGTAAQQYQKAS